jgi:hypothetical protein
MHDLAPPRLWNFLKPIHPVQEHLEIPRGSSAQPQISSPTAAARVHEPTYTRSIHSSLRASTVGVLCAHGIHRRSTNYNLVSCLCKGHLRNRRWAWQALQGRPLHNAVARQLRPGRLALVGHPAHHTTQQIMARMFRLDNDIYFSQLQAWSKQSSWTMPGLDRQLTLLPSPANLACTSRTGNSSSYFASQLTSGSASTFRKGLVPPAVTP